MRPFFDTHLHLPRATPDGVDEFAQRLTDMPGFVGGLLVLNTAEEVAVVAEHATRLPPGIVIVPHFRVEADVAPGHFTSGWYKVHPTLHQQDLGDLDSVLATLSAKRPRGVMVHCFPWGTELRYNVSLPYVIRLAQALPDSIILATHGGGYESWQFRAHAGGLRNVHFDFSMTLDYYERSDVLRPLQRYLKYSPNRIHFGSDWPCGDIARQLAEMERWAEEIGMSADALYQLLLGNARAQWPEAFGAMSSPAVPGSDHAPHF